MTMSIAAPRHRKKFLLGEAGQAFRSSPASDGREIFDAGDQPGRAFEAERVTSL